MSLFFTHQFTTSPVHHLYNDIPKTRNTLCAWGFEITEAYTGNSYSFEIFIYFDMVTPALTTPP